MKVKEVQAAENEKYRYRFKCPGCNISHEISDKWEFNGDFESPTFNPSIDFTGGRYDKDENWIDLHCHSYVEKGMIRFLNDCSHKLAGQTVELPDLNKI